VQRERDALLKDKKELLQRVSELSAKLHATSRNLSSPMVAGAVQALKVQLDQAVAAAAVAAEGQVLAEQKATAAEAGIAAALASAAGAEAHAAAVGDETVKQLKQLESRLLAAESQGSAERRRRKNAEEAAEVALVAEVSARDKTAEIVRELKKRDVAGSTHERSLEVVQRERDAALEENAALRERVTSRDEREMSRNATAADAVQALKVQLDQAVAAAAAAAAGQAAAERTTTAAEAGIAAALASAAAAEAHAEAVGADTEMQLEQLESSLLVIEAKGAATTAAAAVAEAAAKAAALAAREETALIVRQLEERDECYCAESLESASALRSEIWLARPHLRSEFTYCGSL
jgi:hypothetical protein